MLTLAVAATSSGGEGTVDIDMATGKLVSLYTLSPGHACHHSFILYGNEPKACLLSRAFFVHSKLELYEYLYLFFQFLMLLLTGVNQKSSFLDLGSTCMFTKRILLKRVSLA